MKYFESRYMNTCFDVENEAKICQPIQHEYRQFNTIVETSIYKASSYVASSHRKALKNAEKMSEIQKV